MMQTRKQLKYLVLGSIIFTLYIFAALLFKPSGTETSWEKVRWSIMIFFLIVFFSYFAFAVFWRTHETGFRIFTTADGKSRFGLMGGLFDSSSQEGEKGLRGWWFNKGVNGRKWFLYSSLAVITIIVAYMVPDNPRGDDSNRYVIMGAIVLLVLHLIIWPFFTDKTSPITKFIVSVFLIFCVVAFVFPKTADRTWKDVKGWKDGVEDGVNEYDKAINAPKGKQSTRVANTIPTTIHVEPGDDFKKVNIPPEKDIKKMVFTCLKGCVAEIQHEGGLLCNGDTYQGVDCGAVILGYTSRDIPIYREQFLIPDGDEKIGFPEYLIHVRYSFATTRELGPVDVGIDAVID